MATDPAPARPLGTDDTARLGAAEVQRLAQLMAVPRPGPVLTAPKP